MGPFRLLVSETRASRRLEENSIRMSFALVATASILASVARAGPGWQCNGPDYIALPAATKLDQIWENCAADQTSAPWLSMLEVGEIMFESMCPTFNTSLWGDQWLYIRHDDEAHDLVLKPEWNQYTPQFGPFFEYDPTQSSKCPYSRNV